MHTLQDLQSGKLKGLKRLDLCDQLTECPREILNLKESLEILNLSGNSLSTLPDFLAELPHLQVIFCSENQFEIFPSVLAQCPKIQMIGFKSNRIKHIPQNAFPPHLRWLILTDNQLVSLPESLGECAQLQKLMLSGNRLKSLPQSLQNCTKLELIRIAANQFKEFPSCVLNLPKLAWIAYSGNPFSQTQEEKAFALQNMAEFPSEDYEVLESLGAGASGHIYKSKLKLNKIDTKELALKVFKGSITSDGLPELEMQISLLIPPHPTLISALGKTQVSQNKALFFELIPPQFKILAGPPSLESCTRDVYSLKHSLPINQVYALLFQSAQALHHIHEQNVIHGDFYAHNLLHFDFLKLKLTDFGAASILNPQHTHLNQHLKAFEVRAWGILCSELIHNLDDQTPEIILNPLRELAENCQNSTILERPRFDQILKILKNLEALLPFKN